MFKKIVIIGLLVLSMVSCARHNTELEQQLINNKWVYCHDAEMKDSTIFLYYLKFFPDGTAANFYISDDKEAMGLLCRKREDGEDEWSYNEKDSTLIIFANEFKVLSTTKDAVCLKYKKDNFKVLLYNITNMHYDEEHGFRAK